MAKYRKITEVEAELFHPGLEDGYHVYESYGDVSGMYFLDKDKYDPKKHEINFPAIKTLEGWLRVNEGDYVVSGINGERYPVKPEIFEKTYELVEETA